MPALLHRVAARVAIHAHRPVRALLDGEYASVFHGRSLEFDDLREYVPGDEVKDIDWKATARIGAPMTRRYIASRKHTVLLVADTGSSMAALAASGETKSEIAVLAAGVIGWLAVRHGDRVGLLAGDADGVVHRPAESTEAHLERMLQLLHSRTRLSSARSDLSRQLRFIARTERRRAVLFVVADDRGLDDEEVALLRRLAAQHEVLRLVVADADPTERDWAADRMYDVAGGPPLPAPVRRSAALRAEFAAATRARLARDDAALRRLGIVSRRVRSSDEVVPALLRLLESHRMAGAHRRTGAGGRARR